jgi:hypothetical protein
MRRYVNIRRTPAPDSVEHSELIGLLCYGGAVVGAAIAAGFLLGPLPR